MPGSRKEKEVVRGKLFFDGDWSLGLLSEVFFVFFAFFLSSKRCCVRRSKRCLRSILLRCLSSSFLSISLRKFEENSSLCISSSWQIASSYLLKRRRLWLSIIAGFILENISLLAISFILWKVGSTASFVLLEYSYLWFFIRSNISDLRWREKFQKSSQDNHIFTEQLLLSETCFRSRWGDPSETWRGRCS